MFAIFYYKTYILYTIFKELFSSYTAVQVVSDHPMDYKNNHVILVLALLPDFAHKCVIQNLTKINLHYKKGVMFLTQG